ncbi:MAG: hypothetical protein LAO05_18640 [Acidobacteriia bacterium]|nr:hypothetical protein [Terriglobia bacterium]
MKIIHQRWMAGVLGLLLLTVLYGCLVARRGDDRGVGGAYYAGGYYEPYGHDYGGWGHGYQVAPPRNDERRPQQQSAPHVYRPAPTTRLTPSIPKHQRPPEKSERPERPEKH